MTSTFAPQYDDGMTKRRITVTIDAEVADAAAAAVAEGRAVSVSAWVNDALLARTDLEQRRVAFAAVLADYEAEHGVITREQMDETRRQGLEAAARLRAEVLAELEAERTAGSS